jgi:hypothetical protein
METKEFKVVFGAPKKCRRESLPYKDAYAWVYPLSIIDQDFIGKPEENSKTIQIEVLISIVRSTFETGQFYGLQQSEKEKMVFEIARREIKRQLESGTKPQELHPIILHSANIKEWPTLDASRIPDPNGLEDTFIVSTKIGFQP